jgi:regulatory protein
LIFTTMPAGTITALVVQATDSERVNVFIDGQFAIGVSIDVAYNLHLRKGQELSSSDWERLVQAERGSQAWNAALRLLSVRPRTEHELRDRLRRKNFEPSQIDAAIERLRNLDLIDDAQFARLWVANRQHLSPRGAGALRQELRAKGVERQIAEQVLADTIDADDERAACEAVARRALHKYANAPDWATFSRRLGGFLQRRGFRWETIKPIIQTLWHETHTDANGEWTDEDEPSL